MSLETMSLEEKSINTIRTLSMDAVQAANSGHPGTPMALAPLAYHLYHEVMAYNPKDTSWADRDRFVLSCGHASMLQYALLHLTGFDLSLEELKNFRQWDSKTPGHPEVGHTAGVEMTTGPLGQGISTAVGIALAEAHLADVFNTEAHTIVDHRTYVIASDGDLMEGVSAEAASLAGHLGLGKLICYWDDNKITIDGDTDLSFTEDVGARYEAYGWQVIRLKDGTDLVALRDATRQAQRTLDKPTLIVAPTVIGVGSPNKSGKAAAHGAPLGVDEIKLTKAAYGWPEDSHFLVPSDVAAHMGEAVSRGEKFQAGWSRTFSAWADANPALATQWRRRMAGELPEGWDAALPVFEADAKGMATRASSGKVLGALMKSVPELVGGSADLSGSNKVNFSDFASIKAGQYGGQLIHFGVREHGMAALCAGMALHGGVRPFCATFLVFTDYMRPAIRLAALMKQPVIYVMTHDSIGLGEDGPTHQPIEHVGALRAIPNVHVMRPGDANETREAWRYAMTRTDGPTVLVLTRQNVATLDPTLVGTHPQRGAYVVADAAEGDADAVIMATGSELGLALDAHAQLSARGVAARVVSMPCHEAFLAQSAEAKAALLPAGTRRVAIEAGDGMSWDRFLGLDGTFVGMRGFGASAPAKVLYEKFGITAEAIVDALSD